MKPATYVVKTGNAAIKKSKTGTKLELAILILEAAIKLFNWGRNKYRDHFSYHIRVTERQALFKEVNDWLLEVLPDETHRSLSVYSHGGHVVGNDSSPDESDKPTKVIPMTVKFNDKARRKVLIDGHKVEVHLKTPDITDAKFYERMELENEIVFTVFSLPAQKAVLKHLEKLNQQRVVSRKASLHMLSRWGEWRRRSDLPPRTMDSVSLPEEQKERVIKDLGDFLSAEDRYNSLAVPFHRGYMFHGPPGTGKTSLAKALANHFNLDLWYISLSDMSNESGLMSLLAGIGPRSMLLLEDIDTIQITHDRDSADQGKISMGSLLNALDGVGTPHGMITVMTTNRFDILDPALTRAGRMDMIEMLDYPELDTVSNLFEHFYGQKPGWVRLEDDDFIEHKISISQIAELMKRNMNDPQGALRDIQEMVKRVKSSSYGNR